MLIPSNTSTAIPQYLLQYFVAIPPQQHSELPHDMNLVGGACLLAPWLALCCRHLEQTWDFYIFFVRISVFFLSYPTLARLH